MSRTILAGLVALLGLSTGAAFATNDFLAQQAASQAAFLGSGHLAAEGGSGGSAGNTSQGSSSAKGQASDNKGGGSDAGAKSPSKDSGSGVSKDPGGGGGTTPANDRQRQNETQGRGGAAPSGKDPAMGGNNPGAGGDPTGNPDGTRKGSTPAGGDGCSGGGGCDSGAQQATRDKEAAAQKAADRTQDYAKDLSNYNRDRQSTPADIKAAKDAAVSRLSTTRSISPSVPTKPTTPTPSGSYFSNIPSYNPPTRREVGLADLNATLEANRQAIANAQKESAALQDKLDAFNKANPDGLASSQPASEVDPKTANAQRAEAAKAAAEATAKANEAEIGRLTQTMNQQAAQRAASQKAAADAAADVSEKARLSQNIEQQRAAKVAAVDKANAEARSLGEIAADMISGWFGGDETDVAEQTPVKNNVTEINKTPGAAVPRDVVPSVSPAERALMNPPKVNQNVTVAKMTTEPTAVEELGEPAARAAGVTEPGVEDPGTTCAACGDDYEKNLAETGVVRSGEFFGDPKTMKTPVNQAESNRIAAQQHANFDREVAEAEAARAKTTVSPAGGVVSPNTPAKATITGRSDVGYTPSGYADPTAPGKAAAVSRSVPGTQSAVDPKTANAQKADERKAAEQRAQASAQGLGGFGNYQQNAGTDPSQQAEANSRAQASAEGLGGYGNYQGNVGTSPSQQAEARARAEASAQGLGGYGNYQQNAGTNPSQQAEARARAEASAQGLAGYGDYQQNVGTTPQEASRLPSGYNPTDPKEVQRMNDFQDETGLPASEMPKDYQPFSRLPSDFTLTDPKVVQRMQDFQNETGLPASEMPNGYRTAAERRAEASAQGLGGFGNYQQNAGNTAQQQTDAQARAEASAQGLGGFGNYQNNLGTAPNQSVKTADSGLVETAPGKGDLETEQSLAQKIGGWVKDVFTSAEPMPKPDQIAQKTTVAVAGTVTVNGVKVSVKAERNIETGELSTPIGGVAGDNTSVSAPDGIQTVKTEKGTVVDVKVQGGKVVGISGKERADVAQGLGGFGNYQQNAGTAPSEQARAEASAQGLGGFGNYQNNAGTAPGDKAAAQARADAQARAEASAQGLGGFGNYQQNAGTEPSERVAAENAAKAAQDARIAAMSRGPGLSSPEQAENAFNNALADAKAADAERAAAQPSAVSKIATTIGDTWTGLKDSLASMFGTTPTKEITDRIPGGEETTNVENGVLSYSDNDPSGTPTGIGSVVTQNNVAPNTTQPSTRNAKIDDRLPGGELTDNVGPTGVIKDGNTVISKGAVVTKNDLNSPPAKTTSIEPAVDKPYDQQAVNDALYGPGTVPEAVVPGAKVTPKPAPAPSIKKDDEPEVVVDVENVPEDAEEPAPKPAEKKKGVIETIRSLLPGGNPPKQPRDEGGGSDSDRPWWVKEQARKEPVATTTTEYNRSWIEALRARLGW